MVLEIKRNNLIISLFLYCLLLVFPFVIPKDNLILGLLYDDFSLYYVITIGRQAIGFFGFIFLVLIFSTFYQIINIEEKKIQYYGSILNLILNLFIIIGVWTIKKQLIDLTGSNFGYSGYFYLIYFIYLIYMTIMYYNYFVGPINFEGRLKEIQSDRDILFNKSLEKLKKRNMGKKKVLNDEEENMSG